MNIFKDISILAWNVRGFANRKGQRYMFELFKMHKLDLVFLFETRVGFSTIAKF